MVTPAEAFARHVEALDFWVIYDRPSDYPEHVVLRRQSVAKESLHYGPAFLCQSVEQARRLMPRGLMCVQMRDPDPAILEVWM